jgi:hypothetical protein
VDPAEGAGYPTPLSGTGITIVVKPVPERTRGRAEGAEANPPTRSISEGSNPAIYRNNHEALELASVCHQLNQLNDYRLLSSRHDMYILQWLVRLLEKRRARGRRTAFMGEPTTL